VLVFAGAYLLLRMSFSWVEAPYAQLVRLEIETAVRWMSPAIEVEAVEPGRRRGLQGMDFDLEVRPARASGEGASSASAIWPMFVSSRHLSFDPTALLLALGAATPAALGRRACALLLGCVLLHGMLVAFLVAELRYSQVVEVAGKMGLLEFLLVSGLRAVGGQAETQAVLPVLLWAALFPDVLLGGRVIERRRGGAETTGPSVRGDRRSPGSEPPRDEPERRA